MATANAMSIFTLNFHGVGPISRAMDPGERNCWLDQDLFEAVLERVAVHPHVRITVDDGNSSDCEIILPALLSRGLHATFFVCSGRLDQPTFLSRMQVCELQAHGMGIGSHGVAHVPWRHLHPQQLRDEIEGSRRILEELCGVTVDTAACPFGSYDRNVLRALRRAEFRLVYTSDGGIASPEDWIQPRITVTRSMSTGDIDRLVEIGPGAWKQFSIGARRLFKKLR